MSSRTEERLQQLVALLDMDSSLTPTKLAKMSGIPRTSINRYLKTLGRTNPKSCDVKEEVRTTGPAEDIQVRNDNTRYAILSQKYHDALDIIEDLNAKLSTLIDVGSTPDYSPITTCGDGEREVVPVVVASDWHIEEQVKAAVTNGMNEYNLEIAEKSVQQFFTNSCELIRQAKRDSKVSTVVVAILGDIINGVLRDEDLQQNQQTPIEAFTTARTLIYRGLRFMAENTRCNIRVICCVGNHGRLTDKIYPSNQVRNSLEYLLYKTLERDFRDHDRVKVIVSEAGYYIQDIYGLRIRFHHGHTFRFQGGIGGLSVPVLRKISQLNLIEKADLDVCGHFHSMQIFTNCILNGSLVGANGYSIQLGIPFEPPRQTFFLIDSKYGRSMVAPIFIDREVKKEAINKISID